jgi:hypothetical protein
MDSQQRRRHLSRKRNDPPSGLKATYGSRQICIEMDRATYDDIWNDPLKVRSHIENMFSKHPELFPAEIKDGFVLAGMLRESRKMPGIRLRQIRTDGGVYTLRPSFVMPWFSGDIEELEKPLLLMSHGVPCWLITEVFGRNDMFWDRQVARLGRNSVVGTTINAPEDLPAHVAADEHHVKWQGQKGYVATTAAQGCLLGVALTDEADVTHLQEAYGVFADEAHELSPDYQPQTVNTDGWWATQNAFKALYPQIVVILCFLHGFLKVRDRCYKDHELHEKIWDVYHALHIRMFDQRMKAFKKWFEKKSWSKAVSDMTAKLWKRTRQYREAFKHPECYRTSNQVDRLMNRMTRCMYAGRGIHGHQRSSERRLRGWALLNNFRPFAKRAGQTREFTSPAHRLNKKTYHENWLTNLMISASMAGQKSIHTKR